jgi:microcystin-dependent protein
MADPYLSEIALFSFDFPPRGWARCEGQLLPINQNQALFSLLGTTYGGDGRVTFALPDLRGRVPLGFGLGPGLGDYVLGQVGGSEAVTLGLTQMAQHTHAIDASAPTATMKCRNGAGNQRTPAGNVPAVEASGVTATYSNALEDASMSTSAIVMGGTITAASSGGNQPHSNVQPFLTLAFCIALVGTFPSPN